ncbi:hypothetical protein BGX21_008800 [Mortierella sp. AD011]|nr:hypothetical protein BGX20_006551 [Mortierella sp. AD010]KAF9397504.1 hypothetical protein BGX21_008800 [Mortierella sp. AD011]
METLPVPAADIYEPFHSEFGRSFPHIHNTHSLLHTDKNTDTGSLENVGDSELETQDLFLEEDHKEEEVEVEESEFAQERLVSSIESVDYIVSKEGEQGVVVSSSSSSSESQSDHDDINEYDEAVSTIALLEPDTDITPTLPIVEVVFEETLHELFTASSDAFKSSRRAPLARGALLFPNNESLLEEPLSVLFEHLREDLLVARFGADAVHYGMSMVFKGLDDLWLSEHESSASDYSLAKLVRLFTVSSGLQGEEMLLEPFRIELSVQETFLSHLNRLENQNRTKVHPSLSAAEIDDAPFDASAFVEAEVEAEAESETIIDTPLNEDDQEDSEEAHILSVTQEHSISTKEGNNDLHTESDLTTNIHLQSQDYDPALDSEISNDVYEETGNKQADENELTGEDEPYYITEIDVDSLACFDDTAYDEDHSNPEDELTNLQADIAAHGSMSPTARSPKRSVEEMIDLLDDEFVNELSPDRELHKKAKTEV